MNAAQINAINAAKKNGGRALTTAQVRAVGDEKAFAEATAKRDAWDNARAEHMAEMKAKVAANKYAHLTFEEIEDDELGFGSQKPSNTQELINGLHSFGILKIK